MLDFNFYLDTPRLTVSHFNASLDSHCDFLVALYNSPEVRAANAGVALPIPDREAARKNITDNQDRLDETGYGRYLVCLKPCTSETNALPFSECVEAYTKIGIVGLKVRKGVGAPSIPDIGFSLLRAFWGKGYATEAASALMKYFEDMRRVSEILGFCNPDNESSKSLFRRLGFEERGVMGVKGLRAGKDVSALVWSRGLKKDLEEYGLLG